MSAWETTYGLLVVQVTLLSVMAGIAYLVIARRHPATAKRLLGMTALLLLGLTAVAGLPLPGSWSVDIWPKETMTARPAESAPRVRGTIGQEALTGMPEVPWTSVADPVTVPAEPLEAGGAAPSRRTPSENAAVFRWTLLPELLLLAGGVVAGARLIRGLWSTHRVLRRAETLDDVALVGLAEEIRRSIGCRHVGLRVSTEIPSAATVGWRRPVLIVAADWRRWSERELRAVLAHEMTHVRLNDYLTGLVARITMLPYFYHPLVRWLGTRFFLAQEAVADAAAARFVGGRADYLAALGRIALRQDRQVKSLPVLAFTTSFSTFLMRRIAMLETKDGRYSPVMRLVHWATLGCLCLGAVAVSALRAPAQNDKASSENPVRAAREEPAKSIGGNAGPTAKGPSAKSEKLPPLPRSVIYKVMTESRDVAPHTVKVMMLGPDRTRQESLGEVIAVSNQRTSIWLNSRDKKATIIEYPENEDEDEELGLFGGYRKLLTDPRYMPEVKRDVLGESEIDGRRVVGHRLTYHRAIVNIWVDPNSLLPVQIERVMRMHPDMKTIQTDFVYNVDLDESVFSVEPPAGYTVHRRRAKSGSYEEKDLIETLRQYRLQRQNTFPDTLDGNGDRDLVRKKSQALGDDPTPEQREEHREWLAKLSRGRWFVDRLSPEPDAHYAGKGVKVDATDTPIFWYRPEGTGEYRVIRADLSVIETERPPEIPGARAIDDWGKEARASKRPWRNRTAAYNVQNLAPLVRQMGILPYSLRNELKVRVLPGSAAEKAGIRTGDRITALGGLNVKRVEDVAALWALLPFYVKLQPSLLDDGVPLTILREGRQVEVKLAGDVLRGFFSPADRNGEEVQNLRRLVRQIGIEPHSDDPALRDVIRIRVLPGSAAEKAGIRSGDRITALDGDKVERFKDVAGLLAWVPPDKASRELIAKAGVRLTLLREGRQVEVTLPGDVFEELVFP